MNNDGDYIRFDWAIKRILRDKANAEVLEGLMTVLIGEPITITEMLESEGNQDSKEDKLNRVDVKAKTDKGEYIIVEVQLARERHFMQRILFGTSKAIVEQMKLSRNYEDIKKVYSINVLYFDLVSGDDYVSHGTTTFHGMTHPNSVLQFNKRESDIVRLGTSVISPREAFPEYFLLRVNQFNEVAKTPIEEWMDYLKSGAIKPDTKTPGLQAAREKLNYMKMTDAERHAYDEYMVSVPAANDVWETAKSDGYHEGRAEGRAEGLAEGRAEGRADEKRDIALKLKQKGMTSADIAEITGLTKEHIENL